MFETKRPMTYVESLEWKFDDLSARYNHVVKSHLQLDRDYANLRTRLNAALVMMAILFLLSIGSLIAIWMLLK